MIDYISQRHKTNNCLQCVLQCTINVDQKLAKTKHNDVLKMLLFLDKYSKTLMIILLFYKHQETLDLIVLKTEILGMDFETVLELLK